MQIHGFNKTTLLDYPKHLAATIFLGNCNYRCPFCHNSSLVLSPDSEPTIPEQDVLSILEKRKNILEGVCITGGEPTIHNDLPDFIEQIKSIGLKVKLDTNGTNYSMLEYLIKHHSIDYVAMDIKSSKEHYDRATGISNPQLSSVSSSVNLLLENLIDYEFRTTVVKELVCEKDIISIGQWISGARAYYLQAYKDSPDIIGSNLHGYTLPELKDFVTLLTPYITNVGIRGID
ncbi:anaerobic ribonucleoside-triphosphate reductase activating protein [Anaeromicropila herbilytica]|uniref:Anaerobic ribonucleoside-triphosphate reductase activating protein n=1 Tax=Anaeromicropila herbilytica TaxID=2785025 RepID=A0A7R7IBG7_9FIRM|nr:anaerobic ribonucleoside-triphosphate reductase activating protein [Anaeromicropila herbilytica]BCN28746.1 anaerobic ribonucleoside-triphosphate reductase activating protein [Anaeromicropila herbilytica]